MTATIPMCWKCASKITKSNGDGSSSLVGCKEDDNIHNYNDAEKLCPVIGMKTVEIHIQGGAIIGVEKPDCVEIIVKDYDTDGVDIEVLKKDKDGDEYQEFTFPVEK